jgi:hypothetical protein
MPVLWDPTNAGAVILGWWDATKGVTYNSSNQVTQWNDQSGAGNTMLAPNIGLYVQGTIANFAASTTFTQTLLNTVKAGNAILVVVSERIVSPVQPTVTDNQNNTYVLVASNTTNYGLYVFIALNVAGGSLTATVSWAGASAATSIATHEFSGLVGASVLDQSAIATQTTPSSPLVAGPITTTATDLLFTAFSLDAGALSAWPGGIFTSNLQQSPSSFLCTSCGNAQPGTYSASWAWTGSPTTTFSILIALKVSTAGNPNSSLVYVPNALNGMPGCVSPSSAIPLWMQTAGAPSSMQFNRNIPFTIVAAIIIGYTRGAYGVLLTNTINNNLNAGWWLWIPSNYGALTNHVGWRDFIAGNYWQMTGSQVIVPFTGLPCKFILTNDGKATLAGSGLNVNGINDPMTGGANSAAGTLPSTGPICLGPGGFYPGAAAYLGMWTFLEVIMFNTVLTATQITNLNAYFKSKWGV